MAPFASMLLVPQFSHPGLASESYSPMRQALSQVLIPHTYLSSGGTETVRPHAYIDRLI